MLGAGELGSGRLRAARRERGAGDLRGRLVDAERVVERRRQAGQRRLVGLADHDGLNVLEPFGQAAGAVKRERAVGVGRHEHVERAREAAAAGADGEGDVAVVEAVELDVDLEAGDRARERREDLADEAGLGDVGVLVADDAGVVGGRRGHHERRDDGRQSRSARPRFWMKFWAWPLAPEGNAPVKLPSSELPTRSVTPGAGAALAQDDDRVLVGRQLGLGQAVVVERDREGRLAGARVGARRVADRGPGVGVEIDVAREVCRRRRPGRRAPLAEHEDVREGDRRGVERLAELDLNRPAVERRSTVTTGAVASARVKVIGPEGTRSLPSLRDDRRRRPGSGSRRCSCRWPGCRPAW